MRKILSIILALVLMSSVSFAQFNSSQQDAKYGKPSFAKETKLVKSNRAIESIYYEDFEGGLSAWINYDEDEDGYVWNISSSGMGGSNCMQSESYINTKGIILFPDNWIASSAIDLSSAVASTTLEFWRKAKDQNWPAEVYTVYLSTSGNTVADFTGANGHVIQAEETVSPDDWQKRSISLAAYTGGDVYIAFRHHDCSDMFALLIDDVEVFENNAIDAGILAITAPSNEEVCALTATEDVTFTIFNYGGAPLTGFEVSYTINGGTVVTETVGASIAPSTALDYTFTQQADLSALGYYTFNAMLDVTGDSNPDNDSFESMPIANGDDIITFHITPGDNEYATYYGLINSVGETVFSGGPGIGQDPGLEPGVEFIIDLCAVSTDCYTAYIGDSWGNGGADFSVDYNGIGAGSIAAGSYEDLAEIYHIGDGCQDDDLLFNSITINSYVGEGDVDIKGMITNTGTTILTSFDVVYDVDGTTSAVYTVDCNVEFNDNYEFTHDEAWTTTSIGMHNIEVALSNFNGNGTGNEVLDTDFYVLNEVYPKVVVYEEATGTWCSWCVRGIVGLNTMAHNITDDSWIGIAVHNSDPMVASEYDNALGVYIPSYPSGLINRNPEVVDPSLYNLELAYAANVVITPEAKIEITNQTWSPTSRDFTVEVTTTFGVDLATANYNAALIVVEDGVTGTTSAWNQANSYSGSTTIMVDWDGTDYNALPNPVPAADMVYHHVGRQLVGGWAGVAGSIPTSVSYNVGNTYTFSGNIPADNNEFTTHYVAMIINNANGTIVNASKVDLHIPIGLNDTKNTNFKIYPNPTTSLITIEGIEGAQVLVYNMIGEVVYSTTNAVATTTINLSSLQTGNYIVKIISNNEVSTQKIVLIK